MEPSKEYEVKQRSFTVYYKKHLSKYMNEKESTVKPILLLVLIFQLTRSKEDALQMNLIWGRDIFNKQIKHRRNRCYCFSSSLTQDLCATFCSTFHGLENTNEKISESKSWRME